MRAISARAVGVPAVADESVGTWFVSGPGVGTRAAAREAVGPRVFAHFDGAVMWTRASCDAGPVAMTLVPFFRIAVTCQR